MRLRAELREWSEVYLNDASYIVGKIYNDRLGIKPDGRIFRTGFIINRIDRGYFIVVSTAGQQAFKLVKSEECITPGN
jgi:hypothetical protein